jgi:hypothetical protein
MPRCRPRTITTALLSLHLSACAGWSRPDPSVSPAVYVATQRPSVVRVLTTSGKHLYLRRPEVVGDSLCDSSRTTMVREATRVAVPRPEVGDIRVLEADEGRYRSVQITLVGGLQLQLDDPVITSDSVSGTTVIDRERRTGIPLADIRQIRVRKMNWPMTAVGITAGAAAVAVFIFAATFDLGY